MNNRNTPLPVTRRDFLRASGGALGVIAFSGFAPSLLARAALTQTPRAERDRTILVLIQLAGGNDGLNTIIPHADDNYHRLRPNLAIQPGDTLPLADGLGFHPSCDSMRRLFNDGKLSIIQNVGYPNPNRSHFRSSEIWETSTDSDTIGHTGWVGRYFDNACSGRDSQDPLGVHIGDTVPQVFSSREVHNVFGLQRYGRVAQQDRDNIALLENLITNTTEPESASYLRHTMMDALVTEKRVQTMIDQYRPSGRYPGSSLGQSLQRVAALIAGGMETRIYFVSQGGYDTHANQLNNHARLLGDLSGSLAAFQQDLETKKLDDQVLSMTFSEFGRRPYENSSAGTDHGTAAPLFVVGSSIRETLVGERPILPEVGSNRDVEYSTDFRQVYSTVVEKWLDADPEPVIGTRHEAMKFI